MQLSNAAAKPEHLFSLSIYATVILYKNSWKYDL